MTVQTFQVLRKHAVELGPFSAGAAGDSTASAQSWTHWRLARDANQVAWLLLDKSDTKTNVLSRDVLEELGEVLKHLKTDMPKGLVLRSAKDNNFCVGADITEFQGLSAEADLAEQLKAAHAVADKLASLPCPTVAIVHGTCLGGGLELALCCDYRLALPGAQLGLPEILLGLHPGLGGTARMTHLIDPVEAMTLMLTGRTIPHGKAKALGLVDQVVEERHVGAAVEAVVAKKLSRHKQGLKAKLLNSNLARGRIASKMREKSAAKAPPQHYPAPEALIKLWEKYGGNARKMRREEIKSFAKLLTTSTAQNLIRVFFLREGLKRQSRDAQSPAVRHVHVMGAGAMGGDIAGWIALQGLHVTLYDKQPHSVADAVKRAAALCNKKRLSSSDTRTVLDRLVPDLKNAGVRTADVVIEAVPENIELKQKLYAEIEPQLKAGAILATNTSSIPLEKLSESLADPSRLVGLHFFNPVAKMQLVEVVHHAAANPEALARAQALVGQINRLPAPVSSAPGFLVNRVLTPYLLEAMILLDEGIKAEAIDQVALDFGMPMGPVELADQVGLDICASVADMLRDRLDGAMPATPDWLRKKVEDGQLGRKSGRGLYVWEEGKPKKAENPPATEPDTLDRLILPMLNACMACLREGVIENEELLDGAMIFGTGFAPFRGGPLHYARTRGYAEIAERLQALSAKYGKRFAPDSGWTQHS
jgi:3-hydroxyacyl-CoA dehydrogenase/enoyl-CoA hydratase/3-hydroxybutyryl-CoA epimerase